MRHIEIARYVRFGYGFMFNDVINSSVRHSFLKGTFLTVISDNVINNLPLNGFSLQSIDFPDPCEKPIIVS